jgi:lipoprotein-releasing system ATP-binding protein
VKEFRKGSFGESVFSCKLRTYKQGSSASKLCEIYQAMQRQASLGTAVMDDSQSGGARGTGEILRAENLRKTFLSGQQEITPLDGISLSVESGEMIAIVGPSGAGKSTLLHLLGALDTPTSGEVYFAGNSLQSFREEELAEYRNRAVGFVWQRHHLLPDFTAAENVAMPLLVHGQGLGQALRTAEEWLGEVGLGGRSGQQAGELSGGEQQRVAMARALVNHPKLLLADEPTGDLDERNAESIFELMQGLHRSHQLTSILATHNLPLARRTDRVLMLEHGKLCSAESSGRVRVNRV